MLKRFLILALIVAVGVLGMPPMGTPGHSAQAMTAMADCNCPPGAMGDMPCHGGGMDGCPPSLDCMTHCGLAAPAATVAAYTRIPEPVSTQPLLLADSSGRLLSSIYPPYRPPQV
jgi:hypothetical protein